jgi:TM2 domain-containing membrane protein YozV
MLGMFLGFTGIHRFYLGYNALGAVQLLLTLIGTPLFGFGWGVAWLWAILEAVLIFTGRISRDASGRPLKD